MAVRLAALLPRLVVVTVVFVLATGTLTFAAEKRLTAAVPEKPKATAPAVLVVPDVHGQAYVFAKGILEDAGFAWRVTGGVHGFASNLVASQSPAAGSRLVDTGAPTIVLRLARGAYAEHGKASDESPYAGTEIRFADSAAGTPSRHKAKPKVKPKKRVVAKPKAKPRAKPKAKARLKPKVKPRLKPKAKPRPRPRVQGRPAAFTVPGAPKEPLDEITLPARANRLAAWIRTKPAATNRNVRNWVYQHAWIVTGAKFGWWHGAAALRTLIGVDRQVQALWGLGYRSEGVARAALRTVERRSR
jgi:PASTA domain